MSHRMLTVLLVLGMILSTLPFLCEAQAVDDVTIAMLGYAPRQGQGGNYVLVGGVLHDITVSLAQSSEDVCLKAFYDGTAPSTNETNHHVWRYQSGDWVDELYTYYIKPEECTRSGNTFSFVVSTPAGALDGMWRLSVSVDGSEGYNSTFVLEEPVAGISMTAPTFYFHVVPYGTGYVDSYNAADPVNSTDMNTKNVGNVPIDMSITYDDFDSQFTTSNSTGIFHPGEERTHFIQFQAQPWSPRRFTVKGRIGGEPQILITPATVSCTVAPQTVFDVVIIVARPGYDVFQIQGATVQYKRLFTAKYKDTLSMDLYLTGNRTVYLGIEGENITVNSITYLDQERGENFQLALKEETEAHVLLNTTCSVPPPRGQASMLGYIHFSIELSDFTKSGTFSTSVVVGHTIDVDDDTGLGPPSIIAIIVFLVAVGAVLGFMLYQKGKVERERRRELEERIRKRKEKARKSRKRV